MIDLFRAAAHVQMHRGRTVVIKVGGEAISKPALMEQFARQVAVVHALGCRIIVVHGGGPQTDMMERLLGGEPRMVDGRRVTNQTSLRALRYATAGGLNTEMAAWLTAQGAPAMGLCAASANMIVATRRPPMETTQGLVDFGLVGDIASVHTAPILQLVDSGMIPVIAPPAGDGRGGFLNINADLAAAAIASAVGAAKLVLVTGVRGILRNPAEPGSLVSSLSLPELDAMETEGVLRAGMRVKAAAIRTALLGGVERVHVVSGLEPDAIVHEMYTTQGCGTLVTLEPEKAPEPIAMAGA
jgi:acetylglutamate kinase